MSGAFTATESASIAVAWALFVTAVVYRSMTVAHFFKACIKACKTTGVVLLFYIKRKLVPGLWTALAGAVILLALYLFGVP